MKVILPPSETKLLGGLGKPLDMSRLAFAYLNQPRQYLIQALENLCVDQAKAQKVLKLGAKSLADIRANTELYSSPSELAISRYRGTLYEAISWHSLDLSAQSWLKNHVYIQSALWGVISAGDYIPKYRLSASSTLLEGRSLTNFWAGCASELLTSFQNFTLDLRSNDYKKLFPIPHATSVDIYAENSSGKYVKLNHFNKKAKGELLHLIAAKKCDITSANELLDYLLSKKIMAEKINNNLLNIKLPKVNNNSLLI